METGLQPQVELYMMNKRTVCLMHHHVARSWCRAFIGANLRGMFNIRNNKFRIRCAWLDIQGTDRKWCPDSGSE